MNIDAYRIRAHRFLNGDFRSEDLNALFLFMRNRPYGCETVRDIGHMRGHAEGRDRGISLDRIKDQFQMLRIAMWRFAQPGNELDLNYAPSFLFDSVKATLGSLKDDGIRKNLRLKRRQAEEIIGNLERKFHEQCLIEVDERFPSHLFGEEIKPRILKLCHRLDDIEIDILKECTSKIVIKEAYNKLDLAREFYTLLRKYKLVDEMRAGLPVDASSKLAMFAVYAMHDVSYDLPDDFSARSRAGITLDGDQLNIVSSIAVNFKFPNNPNAEISFDIFDTELKSEDWMDPDLPYDRPGILKVPLELNKSAKLVEMKVG